MSPPARIAPHGSWKSPITADAIVAGSISLAAVCWDGKDIYWLEGRPTEGGRYALVRQSSDGKTSEVTPAPYSVRSRVHEYGGGAFLVQNGTIYFSNDRDRCLYRHHPPHAPERLTAESDRRYADPILDAERDRLICICEDHGKGRKEPENYLASVDLKTGRVKPLARGQDFYSSPRLSSDGRNLVWLTWNHPNLPWDGTYLWRSQVGDDGLLSEPTCVAGGEEEAIAEPQWSPDGQLYCVSDRGGWWNLYRCENEGLVDLYSMEAEFTYPHWIFGLSSYCFTSDREILCTYSRGGRWHLARLDLPSRKLQTFDLPFTELGSLHSNGRELVFVGGTPAEATAIIRLNPDTGAYQSLQRSSTLAIGEGDLSLPELVEFPTGEGLTAYGWYYPPANANYRAPAGELPPLLVKSHGGPTAAASASLNLRVQYWTSRGFGYLDVNYGGSTGFGRAYRQRLDKNWGIVDVGDCANGANYLAERGRVDGNRMAISGGSAGGYTTLAALTFRDTFKAGASYYGVSDLTALATDTHKFEARYLDRLVGRYPEDKAIYDARSPLNALDRLTCPVIFFQGLEDKVVPPSQAEMMVEAIKAKGLPVAYLPFEGEQHGFRKAENIKRALEGEFYFYSRIFGFTPAEAIAPVEIMNEEAIGA